MVEPLDQNSGRFVPEAPPQRLRARAPGSATGTAPFRKGFWLRSAPKEACLSIMA
jgi:hypothetical protein